VHSSDVEFKGTNYTVGRKNGPPNFCPYLRQLLTDFKNSFAGTLCGQFAIARLLYIPPRHKCVLTLPCEMQMSEKLTIIKQVFW